MNRSILALLCCGACTPLASASVGSGSGSQGSADISKRFERDMLVRFHMHENFGIVRAIEHLLVRGKLDEARDLARGISQAPDEPGMAAFATQTVRVRKRAAAVATAKTLDDALRDVAQLGAACAACHVATDALPDLASAPQPPADAANVSARMARHRWATDRMWEGMIGLSDSSWTAGADVLAATPLPASELGVKREGLAQALRRTAERAKKTAVESRADVYGDLLVTCATCHSRTD